MAWIQTRAFGSHSTPKSSQYLIPSSSCISNSNVL
ncbi:hypothetical protein E2C01_044656 [Portunus trituberculatus]|uniref:Uncharacterized protein n=1 Tax=Portunus trituberculatus TaxID=210409 RepID=A0A5B7FW74_PORTR|nr:hypothetical protein [Portunus trituberculatus]